MLHPYDRAYFRPKYHISDITMAEKVKDYYRKVVFHAEGYGGSVHHSQSLLQDLEVRKLSQEARGRVQDGIRIINAVDLCRLEYYLRVDLDGSQRRGRIRGKIGVPRSGGEFASMPI